MKKRVILLSMLFVLVAMFTSCVHHYGRQPSVATFHQPGSTVPQIRTSLVQISGDEGVLTFLLNAKSGKCERLWIGRWDDPQKPPQEGSCGRGYELKETMFCTPPVEGHTANVDKIDGKGPFYCAPILFITEGTDVRIKQDSEKNNRFCKNVGGDWQCFPQ